MLNLWKYFKDDKIYHLINISILCFIISFKTFPLALVLFAILFFFHFIRQFSLIGFQDSQKSFMCNHSFFQQQWRTNIFYLFIDWIFSFSIWPCPLTAEVFSIKLYLDKFIELNPWFLLSVLSIFVSITFHQHKAFEYLN